MTLKTKLLNNQLTIGAWITLGHPTIAEIFSNAGFDWVTIDLEHSVISLRDAEELIRTVELSGTTPLVRLTSNSPEQIKRVMDAGSHGIIVPMVNSVDDAVKAIQSVRYPTTGTRGVGLARAQRWGNRFSEYLDWLEKESVVIVQIEHIDAANCIEEILDVEGVDGLIIGPYDLSGSMGIPGQFDDPDFIDVMNKIKTAASNKNKTSGVHVVEPDPIELQKRINEGYRFIAYSLDTRMLDVVSRSCLDNINKASE